MIDVTAIVLSDEAQKILNKYDKTESPVLTNKEARTLYEYGLISKMSLTYTNNGETQVRLNETGFAFLAYQKDKKEKDKRETRRWHINLIVSIIAILISILAFLNSYGMLPRIRELKEDSKSLESSILYQSEESYDLSDVNTDRQ